MSPAQGGTQLYIKLEERLVLQAWLNDLFGYKGARLQRYEATDVFRQNSF